MTESSSSAMVGAVREGCRGRSLLASRCTGRLDGMASGRRRDRPPSRMRPAWRLGRVGMMKPQLVLATAWARVGVRPGYGSSEGDVPPGSSESAGYFLKTRVPVARCGDVRGASLDVSGGAVE